MAKYIDAEKLIHDLEERIFAYSEGYAEGDDCRKDAIETLLKDVRYQCSLQQEQPEVDLEEVADHYEQTKATELACKYGWGEADIRKQCFIAGANWQKEQDGKIKN